MKWCERYALAVFVIVTAPLVLFQALPPHYFGSWANVAKISGLATGASWLVFRVIRFMLKWPTRGRRTGD